MSKPCATTFALFSHLHTDMGESVYAQKFTKLLPSVELFDIPTVVGPDFQKLALLNLALAEQEELLRSHAHRFTHTCDASLVLTWHASLAALVATGALDARPWIAKMYAHHEKEKILPRLYQGAQLVITESLLASERARAYGLSRVLYIPHHFTHAPAPSRHYIVELARRLGKNVPAEAIIVGLPSRFEYWKNCEFALEAVRQLQGKYPLILIVKADFPQQSVYPEYEARFREMLEAYAQEPWLLWDRQRVPYPDVLEHYASFDIALQPSGAEGGSNVVVELMAMGKPVIVLEASSNPYLFRGGVLFAQPQPELQQAQLCYARPQLESLKECLVQLCSEEMRALWGRRAQEIAHARFHPDRARERVGMLLAMWDNDEDLLAIEHRDRTFYAL